MAEKKKSNKLMPLKSNPGMGARPGRPQVSSKSNTKQYEKGSSPKKPGRVVGSQTSYQVTRVVPKKGRVTRVVSQGMPGYAEAAKVWSRGGKRTMPARKSK